MAGYACSPHPSVGVSGLHTSGQGSRPGHDSGGTPRWWHLPTCLLCPQGPYIFLVYSAYNVEVSGHMGCREGVGVHVGLGWQFIARSQWEWGDPVPTCPCPPGAECPAKNSGEGNGS